MKVTLPQIIEVLDYHEFDYLQTQFNKIIRGIQIEEIGFGPNTLTYIGIAYIGNKKDQMYKELERSARRIYALDQDS